MKKIGGSDEIFVLTSFFVEAVKRELTFSFTAVPFLFNEQLEDQRMVVSVDQNTLATIRKNDKMDLVISSDLVEEITKDEKLEICFEFPDATKSPKDFGLNNDTRILGYNFVSIILK